MEEKLASRCSCLQARQKYVAECTQSIVSLPNSTPVDDDTLTTGGESAELGTPFTDQTSHISYLQARLVVAQWPSSPVLLVPVSDGASIHLRTCAFHAGQDAILTCRRRSSHVAEFCSMLMFSSILVRGSFFCSSQDATRRPGMVLPSSKAY
ncbi:hypothetical protein MRB53_038375 [Persea americana]|nr:hypothetical protein MRB53_038375 [Persea americana]